MPITTAESGRVRNDLRSDIELQHLRVFEATYRLRNLTRAAIELELTQPALSKSLRALRARLSDPLFVRTARGMEPSARADSIIGAVRRALRIVDIELRAVGEFDPTRALRLFVLGISDIGALYFLSRLLQHTTRHAPGVQFRIVAPHSALAAALLEGEVDLAVGPFTDLGAGIFQQRLFSDEFVCVVSADHPRAGSGLTLDAFRREQHLVAGATGTAHVQRIVEQRIVQACGAAQVVARVPSFLTASLLLPGTRYVFTMPRRGAHQLAPLAGLRVLPCPLPMPPFEIKQYWHERAHKDPALSWLRKLMFELFGGRGKVAAKANAP